MQYLVESEIGLDEINMTPNLNIIHEGSIMIDKSSVNNVSKHFGFKFEKGGAHTARTIMLDEMELLLYRVPQLDADSNEYYSKIVDDNCLEKRSNKSRILTYRHMADLYTLDQNYVLFRALRYFWIRDEKSHPLLLLLCAYARDSILRSAVPFILNYKSGEIIKRDALEAHIDNLEPNRFSPATLKSVAQNINSSLTKSGHLNGRTIKIRSKTNASTGSMAYALLLSYLGGNRGQTLFTTNYLKLLECTFDQAIELTQEASRKGWLVFKHVGDVIEVLFPNLINEKEKEWLREQG